MEFHVLHGTQVRCQRRYIPFAYGTFTLYGITFPDELLLKIYSGNSPAVRYHSPTTTYNPEPPTRTGLQQFQFRLLPVRSPLLR